MTVSYGIYAELVGRGRTLSESVKHNLDDPSGYHYNVAMVTAITEEFRAALSKALPPGVSLNGEEFTGPPVSDIDFRVHGYRTHEGGELDLKEIVIGLNLPSIAARHRTTVTLYETSNGQLVIDNEYDAWTLHPGDWTHMQGQFATDAEAWAARAWEPSEDDGHTPTEMDDNLTAVAEWTAAGGVRLLVGANQLGGTASRYLGNTDTD